MSPLSIHEELVLMLSFRQVQDGYKVILAAGRKEVVFQLVGLPSDSRYDQEFGCRTANMATNSDNSRSRPLTEQQARVPRKLTLLGH